MRAIGVVLAGGNSSRMRELSDKRAIAAMPIAGSYRSIDFVLSSMTNSNIQRVAVLTQFNARSLNAHLSSSKWWNFGSKQGGLYLFPPTVTKTNNWWYRGTADAIYQNIDFLKESHEPYVVIASGDCVYKLDFNRVLEYHIAKRADVTVVCTECTNDDLSRFGVIRMDEEGRIKSFDEKPMVSDSNMISTGIYVVRRRQLIEMLERCASEDKTDFVRDLLIRYKDVKRIYGYQMRSYWSNISSVEAYYRTNMDFLKPEVRDYFFREYPCVYSRQDDNPPCEFHAGSHASGSLIASGCAIYGNVEGSVIFKNVSVGKGSTVKNSIILGDVHIRENVYLENCIVDTKRVIESGTRIIGGSGYEVIADAAE